MLNSIFRILFISITLTTANCNAQNESFKNLSKYITNNKLYDYGYGLEENESRIDSIVCFNDFMNQNIVFKDCENLNFKSNDSTFTITTSEKKGTISSINILFGKKIINKLNINDTVNEFRLVAKSFRIRFEDKNYFILYLTDEYAHQTFRVQFLGIIIDEKKKSILQFPRYQNTTSLLNITDLDNNKNLDIVCYNPSFSNKVEVFEMKNNNWRLNEKYTCALKSTDNFVWQIDFETDNFLKDYYYKAFR
jgi:hypothetical protein